MRKLITIILLVSLGGALAGCASDTLKAPCPNFGLSCSKAPINSWNYSS